MKREFEYSNYFISLYLWRSKFYEILEMHALHMVWVCIGGGCCANQKFLHWICFKKWRLDLIFYFVVKQDDSYLDSYISTIGVDFVSICIQH